MVFVRLIVLLLKALNLSNGCFMFPIIVRFLAIYHWFDSAELLECIMALDGIAIMRSFWLIFIGILLMNRKHFSRGHLFILIVVIIFNFKWILVIFSFSINIKVLNSLWAILIIMNLCHRLWLDSITYLQMF